jgi:antitoxin ChpS
MDETAVRVWGEVDDDLVRSTLHELDRRLRTRFGHRYARLLLFGSRARGDQGANSDADVAVVFRGQLGDTWQLTKATLEDTYDLLLETGLFIEPHPVEEAALGNPERSANPDLIREIIRDGFAP